jgi:hypothetical protein
VVHVIVDGDVVSVGAVATSSPHATFNSAESTTTPPAAFIVLMSVMAEANQEDRRTRELSRVGDAHTVNAAVERR